VCTAPSHTRGIRQERHICTGDVTASLPAGNRSEIPGAEGLAAPVHKQARGMFLCLSCNSKAGDAQACALRVRVLYVHTTRARPCGSLPSKHCDSVRKGEREPTLLCPER